LVFIGRIQELSDMVRAEAIIKENQVGADCPCDIQGLGKVVGDKYFLYNLTS
jgi:hypothetical protein